MFRNISPDSVRSGKNCLANLGVRSCPVRKLMPSPVEPYLQQSSLKSHNFIDSITHMCRGTYIFSQLFYTCRNNHIAVYSSCTCSDAYLSLNRNKGNLAGIKARPNLASYLQFTFGEVSVGHVLRVAMHRGLTFFLSFTRF